MQLEFNIYNKTCKEMDDYLLQKQLDELTNSLGRVRKKLFAELSEVKSMCSKLNQENEELKSLLEEMKDEKTEWTYREGDHLFRVRESKKNMA